MACGVAVGEELSMEPVDVLEEIVAGPLDHPVSAVFHGGIELAGSLEHPHFHRPVSGVLHGGDLHQVSSAVLHGGIELETTEEIVGDDAEEDNQFLNVFQASVCENWLLVKPGPVRSYRRNLRSIKTTNKSHPISTKP